MQSRTFYKLTREFFSSHPPIFMKSIQEQKNFIADLKGKIKALNNKNIKIEKYQSYYYRQKETDEGTALYIEISDPYKSESWRNTVGLLIAFETETGMDKDKLYVKPEYRDQKSNFSGKIEDLIAFIDIILETFREIDNKNTKSDKIKSLKKGAVLAKIKEIARAKQFNFKLEEYSTKLKLSIQVGEKGIVTMNILYSRFQQEMGRIEAIVDAARELEKSGIVANLSCKSPGNSNQIRRFTKYTEP